MLAFGNTVAVLHLPGTRGAVGFNDHRAILCNGHIPAQKAAFGDTAVRILDEGYNLFPMRNIQSDELGTGDGMVGISVAVVIVTEGGNNTGCKFIFYSAFFNISADW